MSDENIVRIKYAQNSLTAKIKDAFRQMGDQTSALREAIQNAYNAVCERAFLKTQRKKEIPAIQVRLTPGTFELWDFGSGIPKARAKNALTTINESDWQTEESEGYFGKGFIQFLALAYRSKQTREFNPKTEKFDELVEEWMTGDVELFSRSSRGVPVYLHSLDLTGKTSWSLETESEDIPEEISCQIAEDQTGTYVRLEFFSTEFHDDIEEIIKDLAEKVMFLPHPVEITAEDSSGYFDEIKTGDFNPGEYLHREYSFLYKVTTFDTDPDQKKTGFYGALCINARLHSNYPQLNVYGRGIFIEALETFANVSGIIVSRDRLDMNYARNELVQDSDSYNKLLKVVKEAVKEELLRDPSRDSKIFAEAVRSYLKEYENEWEDLSSLKSIVSADGDVMSLDQVLNKSILFGENNQVSLRAIHEGYLVIDPDMDHFLKKLSNEDLPVTFSEDKPIDVVGKSVFAEIPQKDWTDIEKIVLAFLNEITALAGYARRMKVGLSEGTNAWTDGESFIAWDRPYLAKVIDLALPYGLPTVFGAIVRTLSDECAHTHDTRESTKKGWYFEKKQVAALKALQKAFWTWLKDHPPGILTSIPSVVSDKEEIRSFVVSVTKQDKYVRTLARLTIPSGIVESKGISRGMKGKVRETETGFVVEVLE